MSVATQGWYPDPASSGAAPGGALLERYWDGERWTAQTRTSSAAGAGSAGTSSAAGAGSTGTGSTAGVNSGAGIAGELLEDGRYRPVGGWQRVTRQNPQMIRVVLGDGVLARQGCVVAAQGAVELDHEGHGLGKAVRKAVAGEGFPLMRCTGRGEVYLADGARLVHLVHLSGGALAVNGRSVLAFEPSLQWDIERIRGVGIAAGGRFTTRLAGHGWVAVSTLGQPIVIPTAGPTVAEADAAVAWSADLAVTLVRSVRARALAGGEQAQLSFQGAGFVIVQPSPGEPVPPHVH